MTMTDALSVLLEFGVSVPREKIDFSRSPIVEVTYEDLFGDAYGPAKINEPLVFIRFRAGFLLRSVHDAFHVDETSCWDVEAIVHNRPVSPAESFIKRCMLGTATSPFGSRGSCDLKPTSFLICTPSMFRKNLAEMKSIVKLRNSFITKCKMMKSCQQYKENYETIKNLKAENNAMLNALAQQYNKKNMLVHESDENE